MNTIAYLLGQSPSTKKLPVLAVQKLLTERKRDAKITYKHPRAYYYRNKSRFATKSRVISSCLMAKR